MIFNLNALNTNNEITFENNSEEKGIFVEIENNNLRYE